MILLNSLKFGISKEKAILLKITVPEDLNYEDAFEEILNKYASSWHLDRVRTRDFGALFELNYKVNLS